MSQEREGMIELCTEVCGNLVKGSNCQMRFTLCSAGTLKLNLGEIRAHMLHASECHSNFYEHAQISNFTLCSYPKFSSHLSVESYQI